MSEPVGAMRPGTEAATLCLASGSPRRAAILREAGFRFTVEPADLDEAELPSGGSPSQVVARLALAKADAVAGRRPRYVKRGEVILGADTIVVLDGAILGKPANAAQARRMLEGLRARRHSVITAVAVLTIDGAAVDIETTTVRMRDYRPDEVNGYIASGSGLDKAGAYGIQDLPFAPVDTITGCYLNVVGLPLCLTARLLASAGVECPAAAARCSHELIGAGV